MKGIIAACLIALGASAASAATVYLKEGGRLEGSIVSATESEVVLDTAQGRVRVEMSRVEHIDGAPPAARPAPAPAPEEFRGYRRRRVEEGPFEPRTQMLSIDFGLAAPLSSVGFNGTAGGGTAVNGITGPAFGIQYLYYTSPRVGLGFEFDYNQRNTEESDSLLPRARSFVYGDTSLLLGVAKLSLSDRGPVRPFVLLGAGGYRNSLTINAHPQPGFVWNDTLTGETRTLVDDSAAGLAGTVRLGLDFGYYDPSVFSLEAGWTGLTSAVYHSTPQGQALGITGVTGPVNYFTFTGRWGFNF